MDNADADADSFEHRTIEVRGREADLDVYAWRLPDRRHPAGSLGDVAPDRTPLER